MKKLIRYFGKAARKARASKADKRLRVRVKQSVRPYRHKARKAERKVHRKSTMKKASYERDARLHRLKSEDMLRPRAERNSFLRSAKRMEKKAKMHADRLRSSTARRKRELKKIDKAQDMAIGAGRFARKARPFAAVVGIGAAWAGWRKRRAERRDKRRRDRRGRFVRGPVRGQRPARGRRPTRGQRPTRGRAGR